MTKGSAISILYVLAGELIALAFNVKMRTICIHSAHLPGGHRSGLYWSVNYASLQLCRPCSTLMVKATKKIIKKFTKATHGHPLFTKILFENFTNFTQGNGITRSKLFQTRQPTMNEPPQSAMFWMRTRNTVNFNKYRKISVMNLREFLTERASLACLKHFFSERHGTRKALLFAPTCFPYLRHES